MTNTVKWYKDYKRSKLYVRYRINGTSRDETLSLDWFSNPEMTKQVQINKKSERLADEYVNQKRNELFRSDNGLDFIDNQNKSFISFYRSIAEEKGNKSKSTLGGYKSAINKLIDYLNTKGLSDVTFKQVNFNFCNSFKAHLEQRLDISDTTKQKYFKVFKYVTAQAYNRGYHQKFVCKNIKGIRGAYRKHDYLTQEEFNAMYETPTPFMTKTQTRRFFIFSCLTGLPHRECTKLKWDDFYVDTINGERTVCFDYKREKTGKHFKNPLSKDAEKYLAIMRETRECKEYVFPRLRYSAHENLKLQTWANMADVKKKISPHSARATFANLFIRTKGANIMDLKELMGHSDVKTTLMYIGTSLMEKAKAVRSMPTLLSPDNTEISMY